MVYEHGLLNLNPSLWDEKVGLILRRRQIKENDLLLSVYLKEKGIVSAYVKRGAIVSQPYCLSLDVASLTYFTFYWVEDEKIHIKSWEPKRVFFCAREHPLFLLELAWIIYKVLPSRHWDKEIFNLSLKTLFLIERKKPIRLVRLFFLVRILEVLGYGIEALLEPLCEWTIKIKKLEDIPHSKRERIKKIITDIFQEYLGISLLSYYED